jgi:hypothetical protein
VIVDPPRVVPPESLPLALAKGAITAAAVTLFFLPLATTPGLASAAAGTLAAYALARALDRAGIRVAAGLAIAAVIVLLAHLASSLILGHQFATTALPIKLADAVYLGLGCLGLFTAIRIVVLRVRSLAILEVAVIVAALAHTFSDHRHQRIHQPRWLSDWAWSNGIDPHTVLTAAGVAVVGLAAIMLLRRQRLAKLLLSLLLLFGGGIAGYYLLRDDHITPRTDDNGLGLTSQSKPSSGNRRRPDPVAVAVLHDDLPPEIDILYFRQAVRSRLAGDRLVEDNTGVFDRDVLGAYPGNAPVTGAIAQDPDFHRRFPTSMYLMVPHPQPFGLGNPVAYGPLENPDPRRFVAAYDVDSMVATTDPSRLMGRTTAPEAWTDAERAHYLELPDDPRYAALAQTLVREIDPRFVNDQVITAYAIKRFLEKEGFYSLEQKEMVGTDPTARFLFGDLKGYCVHFAHAAVFLFRSQGIPARVALGYAVTAGRRGAGSSMLIMGNEAHAWPEVFLDGVGWVTFDIYPERSDEPPPPPVDEDLESLLGEIARKDPTGGRTADPNAGFKMPWRGIALGLALIVAVLVVLAYAVKVVRRVRGGTARSIYVGVLDRLSDVGLHRRRGESRERHAERLAKVAPSFAPLTQAHLRWALGPAAARTDGRTEHAALARAARRELRTHLTLRRRLAGVCNPFGWLFTR